MKLEPPPLKLIIVCGLSFAGKTTLGDAICAAFGYPQVDVDVTKVDLYGPDIHDADLSRADWEAIYRETDARIVRHLRDDSNVVDASRNFSRDERDRARVIAASVGAETIIVYVAAPESLARRRWAENRARPTRREVSDADFEAVLAAMQPPSTDEQPLILNPDDDITSWLAEHADQLVGSQNTSASALPFLR